VLGGLGDVTRDAWDRLVATGSPFVEWSWLATLEDSGAASEARGWRPHHFALWEGTRLIGACPAYVKSHSDGEFVFDHGWAAGAARGGIAYYPKLLVAVPFTPVTGERFLAADTDRPGATEALAAALEDTCRRERLSSVHVNFCRPQDAEALVARGWLRRSGYQYHWTNAGFRSFDEYLASLRSKRRNQVRRERRELTAQGVEITVYAGGDIPDALFPRMFELYRRTVAELPWGRQYLDRRFFTLARDRLRDRLCFVVARQGGQIIAGTFNVEKGDTLYGRYWGTLRSLRHLHFNVCYYAAIEYAIARGLARFEPGAGGDFKHLRGFDPRPTESVHFIRDSRLRAAIADFLAHERPAVAREIEWLDDQSALKRDRRGPEEP